VADLKDVVAVIEREYGDPCARTASIGGSGTWALDRNPRRAGFPEELAGAGGTAVVARVSEIATPFGQVPVVKVLDVRSQPVLRIPVHGWRFPVPSLDNTLAVFWLLSKLGVEQIVVDASVGGVRAEPWDVVVPDDVVIDVAAKQAVPRLAFELGRSPWVRMKDPFCSRLRSALSASITRYADEAAQLGLHSLGRLIEGGVYHTTPLSVFETATEIREIRGNGATVVGQSTGQEVACARVCGMCFAVMNPVANFAEGLEGGAWIEGGMVEFYEELALPMATALWWTLEEIVTQERTCECHAIATGVDVDRYIWGGDRQ
jgi:purine nucleoside phosphorylase